MKISNQFQLLIQCLKLSQNLWIKFIQSSWPELVGIFFFTQFLSVFILYQSQLAPFNDMVQMFSQLGMGAISLLEAALLLLLIPLRIYTPTSQLDSNISYWQFIKKHIAPLAAESIRMTAFVILWGLLLIIPGLFKQIRWYFVPFVVITDKKYQSGEVDALDRSNSLINGITLLVGIIILTDFVIQYLIDSYGQSFQGPLKFFGLFTAGILTLGVSIYSYILLYSLFKKRNAEVPYSED